MKLMNDDTSFVLTNSTNEKPFTIAATGAAFKILSSSLYSRKVEAIIRELSCNAYDSHVMAGTPEKPFAIHMPTTWEPVFSVEDFGIGLDKDDVESIYTSYFTSTKTDSNEVIGGLGLGSKTPFAYTDSFNLITRKNGKEYSYSAFINTKGEPSVSLLAECDTDLPNGVKVSVPVNQKDFYEFTHSAKRVYRYFRTLPTFVGEHLEVTQIDFDGLDTKNYLVIEGVRSQKNTVYALMGNVCYEVSNVNSTFSGKLSTKASQYMSHCGMIVKFDIGDLDVAASRETISFDEVTEKHFLEKVEGVCDILIADVQEKINNTITSPISAYRYVKDTLGEWAFNSLEYKGFVIGDLKEMRIGEILCELYDAYYRPKFFPKPVMNSDGTVAIVRNLPMFTNFDVLSHIHSHMYYYKHRRSALIVGNTRYSGYRIEYISSGAKVLLFSGTPPGYEITAKDYTRKLTENTYKRSHFHAGTYVSIDVIPDDLKHNILDFFGTEDFEILDTAEEVAARKERIKQSRQVNKTEKIDKPKKPRIKKNCLKIVNTIDLIDCKDKFELSWSEYSEVELDQITSSEFILFTTHRNKFSLVRKDGGASRFEGNRIQGLMLKSGIHKAYVIKESDEKALKALSPFVPGYDQISDNNTKQIIEGKMTDRVKWMAYTYFYADLSTIAVYLPDLDGFPFLSSLVDKVKQQHSESIERIREFNTDLHKMRRSSDIWLHAYNMYPSADAKIALAGYMNNLMLESDSIKDAVHTVIHSDDVLSYLWNNDQIELAEKYLEIKLKSDI